MHLKYHDQIFIPQCFSVKADWLQNLIFSSFKNIIAIIYDIRSPIWFEIGLYQYIIGIRKFEQRNILLTLYDVLIS